MPWHRADFLRLKGLMMKGNDMKKSILILMAAVFVAFPQTSFANPTAEMVMDDLLEHEDASKRKCKTVKESTAENTYCIRHTKGGVQFLTKDMTWNNEGGKGSAKNVFVDDVFCAAAYDASSELVFQQCRKQNDRDIKQKNELLSIVK